MKVTTTEVGAFSKIGLNIVIETEDELKALWHRMNLNLEDVIDHSSAGVSSPKAGQGNTILLWEKLDNAIKKLGLKDRRHSKC